MNKPFLKNNQLIPRKKGEILFSLEPNNGVIHPYLDGYTILPNEIYDELLRQSPIGTKKTRIGY